MEFLRTPDERFEGLPGYPFSPKYHVVDEQSGMRMHYVCEGAKSGRPVLLLHGEPTWSYLYRGMVSILAEAGYRAYAPDPIGFGRSDKPAQEESYSYEQHESWLRSFVSGLGLKNIILVCQDWGGLLGLRLVAREPERFSAVVASNTFLPTGREALPEAFEVWKDFAANLPEFVVSKIVRGGCADVPTDAVLRAYDAPFPDERYKSGARIFPQLVPTSADDPSAIENQKLWDELCKFEGPFVTAFGDSDPITRGAEAILQKAVKGAQKAPHTTIKGAGHFVQEDRGSELAKVVLKIGRTLPGL